MKNRILECWQQVVAEKDKETAIWTPNGTKARTFAEIEAESKEFAARLETLRPGQVVGLQAPNVPAWPSALLGIWRAGGIVLLLDDTLAEGARDAALESCSGIARLEYSNGEIREIWLKNKDVNWDGTPPDLIKLTSGTSGAPRAILFTASQLLADGEHVCEAMGLMAGDLNYGVVAFSHSYGFSNLITPLLCRGIPLVAARDALPRAVIDGLTASRATVLPAVPAIFQAMSGLEGSLPELRLCISAGAPLRIETADAFHNRFGRKVHTFYGASECGGIAYDASEERITESGFVGSIMPGVKVAPTSNGGIAIRSAAVGRRYFPEDRDELRDGVFLPADLLEETSLGWRITGRHSDIINVGGKKANPSEIERVLTSHPLVREAVVFGVTSAVRNQAVCACVVADEGADSSALRAYCSERLSPWEVPRAIVQLDAIPLNARGKVNRAELAVRFADLI